jgi:tetratricopeptide (TPR) repeat protein
MLHGKTIRIGLLALLLLGAVVGGRALADDKNPGQDDLDRATAAKVFATTVSDLAEVIQLCESALAKGLDEANTDFAKSLLASTLVHRAAVAEKVVFRVLTTDPRWPRYRRLALDDLEKAVKLIADQPEALFLIARLNLLPGGDRKRALEALGQSIRLSADNVPLRLKALLLRSGMHKDAAKQMADLDEAVRIAPHDAGAVRARGLAHAQRDKPEAALADFQTALELEPDHAPTQEAKAMVLAVLKRHRSTWRKGISRRRLRISTRPSCSSRAT